jgi:2'-5' RNA ligase
LFVAVELLDAVRRAVDEIERPDGDDVRWSRPDAWHVTLRFLGEMDGDDDARAALAKTAAAPATAVIGRVPKRIGPTAIALPVDGLDDVAAAVATAFAGLPGEERRAFQGHLTIGRLKRTGRWPRNGVGPLAAELRWPVGEVALVRSHLGGGPARYEVLTRQPLRH